MSASTATTGRPTAARCRMRRAETVVLPLPPLPTRAMRIPDLLASGGNTTRAPLGGPGLMTTVFNKTAQSPSLGGGAVGSQPRVLRSGGDLATIPAASAVRLLESRERAVREGPIGRVRGYGQQFPDPAPGRRPERRC